MVDIDAIFSEEESAAQRRKQQEVVKLSKMEERLLKFVQDYEDFAKGVVLAKVTKLAADLQARNIEVVVRTVQRPVAGLQRHGEFVLGCVIEASSGIPWMGFEGKPENHHFSYDGAYAGSTF